MSVFFGYEEWLLSKDAPDAITSFYNFGTELALNFQVSPTVFLRPDIGIAYRTGKKESEEHLFITLNRNRINETDLKLGLTCYFNSNEYTIIRFRAGLHLKNNSDDLIFGDDHFGFDFNAGVIFKF
ncbi:MAG: hypothetical protein IAE91_02115 [Ignavibacteriaceae bacterium]|nr:hypothetical protein [Ignavibacteriaceae bacterium]